MWSESAGALYWLDISLSSKLFEWRPQTGERRSWALQELATGLVLSGQGELVVVSETGLNAFAPAKPALRRILSPPFSLRGMRFNDCGCDRLGRLWTGTMVNDLRPGESDGMRIGELYRFDPTLAWRTMADGVGCPNTFAWSLDNRTLYTADSLTGCIYAYDFDLTSGVIVNRRVFAHPQNLGIPDGSAMDAEGFLWNARWGAGCVARFAPDGTVKETVQIPADFVTSCAFGGPNLHTLYVTTARQKLAGSELARQPFAGGIFAFKPDVPGVPASAFMWDRVGRD
jgi:sugar lactone lactonase YvrE